MGGSGSFPLLGGAVSCPSGEQGCAQEDFMWPDERGCVASLLVVWLWPEMS